MPAFAGLNAATRKKIFCRLSLKNIAVMSYIKRQKDKSQGKTTRLLTILIVVYCSCLYLWAGSRFIFEDRWWQLIQLNSFAVYLFLPLPLVIIFALVHRRFSACVSAALSAALWLWFFGRLFVPVFPPAEAGNSGASVKVMTYNILGYNSEGCKIADSIKKSGADIVFLQELNPTAAAVIEQELDSLYPYRKLDPQPGVTGKGTFSRYRLNSSRYELTGHWVGKTQVMKVDSGVFTFYAVNFHAYTAGGVRLIEQTETYRKQAAHELVELCLKIDGPVIAGGDLNSAPLSMPYRIITNELNDAWMEAGWGFGHTFPGAYSTGSSKPRFFGLPIPKWLVRIDYIFHSDHFKARNAETGPWCGFSDHRPVTAALSRKSDV